MFRFRGSPNSSNAFARFASSAAFAPVVIVGGGPVGSYLSALLTQYRVRSIVLETDKGPLARYDDPSLTKPHPRAHVLHTRSVELLRLMGMEDQVKAATPPQEHWKHFLYCPRMLGEKFAYVDHMDSPEARAIEDASPCRLVNFSQPKLDELLAHNALCLGVDVGSKVLYQHTFLDANIPESEQQVQNLQSATETDEGGITVSFRNERTGAVNQMQCGVLVAADGAHSTVRTQMGVAMVGQRNLESFISVHFTCKELTRRLLESNKAAMLSFVFNGSTSTVFVAHDLSKGELVVHIPFFPPHQKSSDFDAEIIRGILSDCIGQELEPLGNTMRAPGRQYMNWDLHSMKPWSMHATCVEAMSASDARVFFVGDAAHQFPPSGGFGVNTGLVDAHNLAWKLACVHHGVAPHKLLETYSTERLPVVRSALRLSLQNYRRGLLVADTLGLSRAALSVLVQGMDASVAKSLLPRRARNALLSACFKFGELGNSSVEHEKHVRKLEQIVCHERKALPMIFPLNDLGFVYGGSDSNAEPPSPPQPQESYIPRAQVGGLLPHAWINDAIRSGSTGTETRSDARMSTVDIAGRCVCPQTRIPRFALVMDAATERHWCDAALLAVKDRIFGVVVNTGTPPLASDITDRHVEPSINVLRFEAGSAVEASKWMKRRVVSPGGAILVRPDGHIAWMATGLEERPKSWEDVLQSLQLSV